MAVRRMYPAIEPTLVKLEIVDINDSSIRKTFYALFTANPMVIKKYMPHPIFARKHSDHCELIDYAVAITDDILLLKNKVSEIKYPNKSFYFCSQCEKPIKTQHGCDCWATPYFLWGLSPQKIPFLEMVLTKEILDWVEKSKIWHGKGLKLDEQKIREVIRRYQ